MFPANESEPVRLEFIGDTIESLRTYDPATQRSVRPIDQLTIVPLSDMLGDDRDGSLFDYLAACASRASCVSEPEEDAARPIARLAEQLQRSYDSAVSRTPEPRSRSGSTKDGTTTAWRRARADRAARR